MPWSRRMFGALVALVVLPMGCSSSALDPALLLLDEPTSALDNAARDVVEAAVAGLVSRRTVVLVSHDAEQVQRLCGRTIDLDEDMMSISLDRDAG